MLLILYLLNTIVLFIKQSVGYVPQESVHDHLCRTVRSSILHRSRLKLPPIRKKQVLMITGSRRENYDSMPLFSLLMDANRRDSSRLQVLSVSAKTHNDTGVTLGVRIFVKRVRITKEEVYIEGNRIYDMFPIIVSPNRLTFGKVGMGVQVPVRRIRAFVNYARIKITRLSVCNLTKMTIESSSEHFFRVINKNVTTISSQTRLRLGCTVIGPPDLHYTWSINGKVIPKSVGERNKLGIYIGESRPKSTTFVDSQKVRTSFFVLLNESDVVSKCDYMWKVICRFFTYHSTDSITCEFDINIIRRRRHIFSRPKQLGPYFLLALALNKNAYKDIKVTADNFTVRCSKGLKVNLRLKELDGCPVGILYATIPDNTKNRNCHLEELIDRPDSLYFNFQIKFCNNNYTVDTKLGVCKKCPSFYTQVSNFANNYQCIDTISNCKIGKYGYGKMCQACPFGYISKPQSTSEDDCYKVEPVCPANKYGYMTGKRKYCRLCLRNHVSAAMFAVKRTECEFISTQRRNCGVNHYGYDGHCIRCPSKTYSQYGNAAKVDDCMKCKSSVCGSSESETEAIKRPSFNTFGSIFINPIIWGCVSFALIIAGSLIAYCIYRIRLADQRPGEDYRAITRRLKADVN